LEKVVRTFGKFQLYTLTQILCITSVTKTSRADASPGPCLAGDLAKTRHNGAGTIRRRQNLGLRGPFSFVASSTQSRRTGDVSPASDAERSCEEEWPCGSGPVLDVGKRAGKNSRAQVHTVRFHE